MWSVRENILGAVLRGKLWVDAVTQSLSFPYFPLGLPSDNLFYLCYKLLYCVSLYNTAQYGVHFSGLFHRCIGMVYMTKKYCTVRISFIKTYQ